MEFSLPTIQTVYETYREYENNPDMFIGGRYLPYRDSRYSGDQVRWAVYKETNGVTYAHVYNSDPKVIGKTPTATYSVEGQPYKEVYTIGEKELTHAASLEDNREKAELSYLTGIGLQWLNERQLRRMEKDRWQILTTGKFTVSEQGVQREIDYGVPAGNFLTVGSGVASAWSDTVNATPLNDIAGAVDKFQDLDVESVDMLMNRTTAKLLLNNEQILDRLAGIPSNMDWNLGNFGQLLGRLLGEVDMVEIYNKGYLDESSTRQRFIPDNKVVLIARPATLSSDGNRDIGGFIGVDSIHAGSLANPMPGRFAVPDYSKARRECANPKVDIVGGVYGLAVLQRPAHVVVLTVV